MRILRQSRVLLEQHRLPLLVIVLLVFAGAALATLLPWPMKLVIDHVLHDKPLPGSLTAIFADAQQTGPITLLIALALAGFAIHLLHRLVQMIQGWLETGVGEQLSYQIGEQVLAHLQKMSLAFHSDHPSGDLVRRITTDSRYLQEVTLGVCVPILTSTVTLMAMFIIMLNIHIGLTLVAIAAAIPIPWLIKALSPRMTEQTYTHQQSEGRVMSIAEQTLSGLPVVQAFGQENRQQTEFKRLSEQSMKDYLKSIKTQLEFSVGVGSSTAIGTAVMLLIGGFSVLHSAITLGELVVFLSYVAALYGPVETLAYVSSTYAAAKAREARISEIYDHPPSVEENSQKPLVIPSTARGAQVEFNQVSFAYKPDEPVLKSVSLTVEKGETVALVGTTGSGKSTLASLIPRFYDPTNGSIIIDGTDISQISLKSLRDQISIVLQDPYLLPISIADNIAFGKPDADIEQIVEAAQVSNAHEFISKLPLGYDTILSEHGADLSGGQRQRLAIARALLKDAPILILDEPTSALDVRTESLFFEALNNLMQGRTAFIIAHRLSTIKNADRIIALEAGVIIESGTHQQLIEKQGFYYNLHQHDLSSDQKAA